MRKNWTIEDSERAYVWVANKAKTSAIFREQNEAVDLDHQLETVLALREKPAEMAEALSDMLTPEAWKRLLNALRQRKNKAKARASDSDSETDSGKDSEVERLNAENARLKAENDSLRAKLRQQTSPRPGSIPADIKKLIKSLVHPDRHGGSDASTKASAWVNANFARL